MFVDEIDAIAGRHARKDPRRRETFEALISQLDGELVSYLCFVYFSILHDTLFLTLYPQRASENIQNNFKK